MGTLYTIVIFFVVLGILVCVHELGHFVVAKLWKVAVDEFGFGFPPKIIGKKFGKTEYSLNWIPLGGFVKIRGVAGDDPNADSKDQKQQENSFQSKGFLAKFSILSAGIGMNIVLAAVLFMIVFTAGFPADTSTVQNGAIVTNAEITISGVIPDTPAYTNGVQPGDVILSYNDQTFESITQIQSFSEQHVDTVMPLKLDRGGEIITIEIEPVHIHYNDKDFTGIGVGLQEIGTVRYPWYQSIWLGIKMTVAVIVEIIITLGDIIASVFRQGTVGDAVAGPVGIAVLTGQVARLGIIHLIQFTALLSINLAIFNLLPIPALDGGRLIFVIVEKIRRKPVNQKIEAVVHNIGFLLLLLLVVIITFKDLSNYNVFNFFTG